MASSLPEMSTTLRPVLSPGTAKRGGSEQAQGRHVGQFERPGTIAKPQVGNPLRLRTTGAVPRELVLRSVVQRAPAWRSLALGLAGSRHPLLD